jgi:hypothetical protein
MHTCMHFIDNAYVCNLIDDKIMVGSTGGVPREWAQYWADENEMQTLTTTMGPLMMTKHPACAKSCKSKLQWKRYVQGASSGTVERGSAVGAEEPGSLKAV